MSRRVVFVGGPADLRTRLEGALDAAFDIDVEHHDDALEAIRLLPNRTVDLFVVLATGNPTPGLDLVQLLREHRVHGEVPILFVAGSSAEREAALSFGAVLASAEPSDDEIRRLAREALAIG